MKEFGVNNTSLSKASSKNFLDVDVTNRIHEELYHPDMNDFLRCFPIRFGFLKKRLRYVNLGGNLSFPALL